MDNPTPRKRRKPTQKEPERKTRKIEHPPTEKPELVVEEPLPTSPGNMKTRRVGTPTLGRSPNYVEKVGLGHLKVITAHGNTDV